MDISNGRFLRRPEVEELIGLRHSALYSLIRSGDFPPPIKLGRASRWVEGQVRAWMDEQAQASHQGAS